MLNVLLGVSCGPPVHPISGSLPEASAFTSRGSPGSPGPKPSPAIDPPLAAGTLVMLGRHCLVAWYPCLVDRRRPVRHKGYRIDGNCSGWSLGRWRSGDAVRAVADPRPLIVQAAVKNCILSLIVIDAARLSGDGRIARGR